MTVADWWAWSTPAFVGVCLLVWLGNVRHSAGTRAQPLLYGLVVGLFCLGFCGEAHHYHFWWYLLSAGVDAIICGSALALFWLCRCRSSLWVARLGYAAIALDLVYFACAGGGHRLPSYWYWIGSNALETLQVLALVIFSAPAFRIIDRLHLIRKGIKPWSNQQQRLIQV